MQEKTFDTYEQYFENLVKDSDYKRLGKAFRTENKYYYYDTGTGKIFECNPNVFDVFSTLEEKNNFTALKDCINDSEKLLGALEEIKQTVESQNILKAPLISTFSGEQVNHLEDSLKTKLNQITFEVTQNCNLRCDYCIYQDDNPKFRNFAHNGNMSFDVIKTVIDYAKDKMNDEFYITFYGGEPLLNFRLIKQCVEYVRECNFNNRIMYSMTTNLTLMTKEIAEYLASVPNFTIVCSIDGDREIHDEHRKMISGEGSFQKVLEGLKNLREAFKEKEENIIFNMVLTPPYTREKFNKIQSFIQDCPYIHDTNTIMYSYADDGKNADLSEIRKREEIKSGLSFMEQYNPIMCWTMENMLDVDSPNKLFTWSNTLKGLLKIHKRGLSEVPMNKCSFNGCCIPGGRRLYITVEGYYHICERIGEAPVIGNVRNGINIEAIKRKYIDEYIDKSIKKCQRCWAMHLCGICYATCYDQDGLNVQTKNLRCISERFAVENQLTQYYQLYENRPDLLEPLNLMELT